MTEDQARLMAKWRGQQKAWHNVFPYDYRAAEVLGWCIDELEALLTSPVVPAALREPLHICRQPGFDPQFHTCLGCRSDRQQTEAG